MVQNAAKVRKKEEKSHASSIRNRGRARNLPEFHGRSRVFPNRDYGESVFPSVTGKYLVIPLLKGVDSPEQNSTKANEAVTFFKAVTTTVLVLEQSLASYLLYCL